jgi:hypothetical protein
MTTPLQDLRFALFPLAPLGKDDSICAIKNSQPEGQSENERPTAGAQRIP